MGESTYLSCPANSRGSHCAGLQILSKEMAVSSAPLSGEPSNISITDWQDWAL